MTTVFISYAKQNASEARRLYEDIRRHGFEVWFDEEVLLPGQRWKASIQDAIKKSRFFIALLSTHSISKKGYVQKELKAAMEKLDEFPEHEIFIVPVRLDDCEILDQRMSDIHYVDLFPNYDKGLAKVLQTLSGGTPIGSIGLKEERGSVPTVSGYQPVVTVVNLSAREIVDGGEIEVTVRAKSNAPVNWLNHRLDGPLSCLHGGGGSTRFHEVEPELWETKWTQRVSPWAPSGIYRFSRISVRSEAELTSDPWGDMEFTVRNDREATSPKIELVQLSSDTVTPGGSVEVTVRARSNAPVNWLDRMLHGPTRILYGGGGTTRFEEVEPGIWEYQWTEPISTWAPAGTYVFSEIAVRNEGQLSSEPWPNLQFTVEK